MLISNFSGNIKYIITFLLLFQSTITYSQAEYFQQRVDHNLTIELDDVRHVVTGKDSIIYHNNSPDTLNEIYFQLYPNAYQSGTALSDQLLKQGLSQLHFSGAGSQGELSGLFFWTDGKPANWFQYLDHKEIIILKLQKGLLPGESLNINVMFRLKIPKHGFGTLGHYNHSYFLSHWYPKPAVYNQNGWQIIPANSNSCYFYEFGDYNLTVTLPRNYVVLTSGSLYNEPDEQKWMEDMDRKTRRISRWGVRVRAGFPLSSTRKKTISFRKKNVNDFAICLDKRFNYFHDTLSVEAINKTIDIHIAFTSYEALYWSNIAKKVKEGLLFFIDHFGGFPYNHISIVQTSWYDGSTSDPGIIRIGSAMAPFLLEHMIMNQIAAQYTSSALGFNGFKNAWITNGLATFYAIEYMKHSYNDTISLQDILTDPGIKTNIAGMKNFPAHYFEFLKMRFLLEKNNTSASLPANSYSRYEFMSSAELKSAFAFATLYDDIGKDLFSEIMQNFYFDWKGKHPSAKDLKSAFITATGKEKDWFFDGLIKSFEFPSYRITGAKRDDDGYLLRLQNNSQIPVPFRIEAKYSDRDTTKWVQGQTGKFNVRFLDTSHSIKRFTIDPDFILPDIYRKNHTIRAKGLLKKVSPVKLSFLASVPDARVTQLYFSPVIGWNSSNGFMSGMAFYSNPLFKPKTEYLLMPLYGFANNKPAGLAKLTHSIKPSGIKLQRIDLGVEAKQYGYSNSSDNQTSLTYSRIVPSIELFLNKDAIKDTPCNRIYFRTILISKEMQDNSSENPGSLRREEFYVNELSWRYRDGDLIHPFNSKVTIQQSSGMIRMMAESNQFINYGKQLKGLSIRAFGGAVILSPSDKKPFDHRFTTSGISMRTSDRLYIHDPLFDHLYLGRSDVRGFLRQHMYLTDAGFKRATTVGNTNRWMAAVNITSTLPGRFPVGLYIDAGLFADDTKEKFFAGQFLYSSGAMFSLWHGVAEIFFPFPFFESDIFKQREVLNNIDLNYFQQIRFVFNIHLLDPLTIPSKIRF